MERLPRYFPLDRILAFADGVFAVVITLLVLGIEVPADVVGDAIVTAAEREKLLHQLLIYVLAFAVIAMYWTQHGLLFGGVRLADRRLVVLNLLFLLPITLLPFVTQLMGERRDDWKAVLVFGATNLVASWLLSRHWLHVLALPETHKGPKTRRLAGRIVNATRFFAAVLTAGVLVSLVNVKAGTALMLVIPFLFFATFVRMDGSPDDENDASTPHSTHSTGHRE